MSGRDFLLSLVDGVVDVGSTAVGIADFASGGRVKPIMDRVGYDPEMTHKITHSLKSNEFKKNQTEMDMSSPWGKIKMLAKKPLFASQKGLEILPSTLANAAMGSKVPFFKPHIKGAIGEAINVVGNRFGLNNREFGKDYLPQNYFNSLKVGGANLLGGVVGGKISKKSGFGGTIDDLATSTGWSRALGGKNMTRMAAEGIANEGVVQEILQTAAEKRAGIITDKDIYGVPVP